MLSWQSSPALDRQEEIARGLKMQSRLSRLSSVSVRPQLAALPIVAALLTGCVTVASDPSICPPIAQYSPEFLAEAADALDALPTGSPLERMIIDYGRERDMLRACQ